MALKEQLERRVQRIKLAGVLAAVILTALAILFTVLWEQTKVVTVTDYVLGTHRSVRYLPGWTVASALAFGGALMAWLVAGLNGLFCKVRAVEAGGSSLILYRGLATALYVDGVKMPRTGWYWEAPLADGSIATVSMSRNGLYAHMTFSNGQQAIEL